LSKKIINYNNGLNDFEIDIKKGLHLNPSDETVQIEGKKIQEENSNDRKNLKNNDEQKNMIRKVLHKIKSCLNE